MVEALDFDWIFDEDNTENFVKLLNDKGSTQLYGQSSIKVFIELMWDIFQTRIIKFQFIPYCIYLAAFFVLTSITEINPMDSMKLIDQDGNIVREESNHEFHSI